MPYDEFGSLVVQRSESSSLSSHRKTGALESVKNASELARRMAEKDSNKPTRGRQAGANNLRVPPPMGEIVEVEGGHIVRSTGRKDRHSKVFTAKGPRDRRVRLSASTAIQFYDLQDRLGYDRPSKAVAWLIEKAKSSIDELAKLPQTRIPTSHPKPAQSKDKEPADGSPNETQSSATATATFKPEHSRAIARERARERAKERTQAQERDSKSLSHPVYADLNLFSNSMIQALQLQNSKGFTTGQSTQIFHPPLQMDNISPDSISRSLHLDPSPLPHQPFYQSLLAQTTQAVQNFPPETSHFDSSAVVFSEADNSNMARNNQSLFSCSAAPAFQVPFIAMSEQHNHEFGAQQPNRMLRPPWNNNNNMSLSNAAADHFGAFPALNIRGQCQPQNSYTVRGTLQSSSSPVRVRPLPSARDLAAVDQLLHNMATTSGGNFSGFRIPARIQGIDEHDDVKPSAASSNSQL